MRKYQMQMPEEARWAQEMGLLNHMSVRPFEQLPVICDHGHRLVLWLCILYSAWADSGPLMDPGNGDASMLGIFYSSELLLLLSYLFFFPKEKVKGQTYMGLNRGGWIRFSGSNPLCTNNSCWLDMQKTCFLGCKSLQREEFHEAGSPPASGRDWLTHELINKNSEKVW